MVSIHGKRELRLQVEVRLLIKWTSNREIILDYPGEPKVTTGSIKVEKGRGRESGRCDYVRRSVMDGSTQLAIAGFEDVERGPWAKECRQPPESGRHKEENTAPAPSWLSPSETLFRLLSQRAFKPLHWWQFFPAATENHVPWLALGSGSSGCGSSE